ncbi:MAG: hypothetical protein GX616_26205, partial [Planctomycetes bacterium]|nr:hypothetical protein [Planctomycetota bacterium]
MARIFKQQYAKTTVARDADGKAIRLANGRYKCVPCLDAAGQPITATAKKWTIEYTDAAGKVRRKSGYTDKLATEQLAAKLERKAARRAEGVFDATDDESLRPIGEQLDEYWQHLEAKKATPRHITETKAKLQKIIRACGFARLLDVQAGPLECFLSKLMLPPPKTEKVRGQTIPDRARGRSPRTRDTYFSAIRSLVRWAVKRDKLPRNPLETISELRDEGDVRRKRRALTDDELRRLLKAAHARPLDQARFMKKRKGTPLTPEELEEMGLQRALIYKTLVMTGLREDELRQITWADVDLKDPNNAWLDIPAAITKAGEAASIPIRADLAAELTAWRKQRGRQAASRPVFAIPQNLARVLKKDLKHAGIDYRTKAGYA